MVCVGYREVTNGKDGRQPRRLSAVTVWLQVWLLTWPDCIILLLSFVSVFGYVGYSVYVLGHNRPRLGIWIDVRFRIPTLTLGDICGNSCSL